MNAQYLYIFVKVGTQYFNLYCVASYIQFALGEQMFARI